ncbi:MAG: exodeoxyribonuclease VII large subunit [Kiritimatiellia bacterium]
MAERIYSVTQLTRSIRRNLLANNEKIAGAWIEGEISGNKVYSSGHRYFTLKDKDASINCVLFAFCLGACDAAFKAALAQGEEKANGLRVQVEGELDLNMTRGQYSFKVRRLRLAGLGDKMAAFNALKAKLEAEGLNKLDHPELRRPLPYLPHRIGIVTSPSGAVIHDMCDVINRRFPNVEIRLYPVKVQGEGAAASVVAGIRFFNGLLVNYDAGWRPDVLIVGRGGGSMEDLWTFNEEPVVRAVAESAIPVISAVGHESDTTLCDYVADLRAGTPSIAGERVVPVKSELAAQVRDLSGRLGRALRQSVEAGVQQVDYLSHRLNGAPQGVLARTERRLTDLAHRLSIAPLGAFNRTERRVQRAALKLEPPMRRAVLRAEARLAGAGQKLDLLNPYGILGRGYSITTDAAGRVVRAAADVAAGTRLTTRLGDGTVESVVV